MTWTRLYLKVFENMESVPCFTASSLEIGHPADEIGRVVSGGMKGILTR